jgi:hypothetical protein
VAPKPFKNMLPSHCKDTALFQKFGESAFTTLWLIVNLIQTTRTVNLNKLKQEMGALLIRKNGKVTTSSSHYKRLIRFFDTYADNEDFCLEVAVILAQMLAKQGSRTLILDGTKWDKADEHVHYLMLSILIRGVAIPIYFIDLKKAGASNQEERIAFIENVLGKLKIKGMTLLGDREYVGKDWFKTLIIIGLGFNIRTRKGDYAEVFSEADGKSYDECWNACFAKQKIIDKTFTLDGMNLKLVFVPNRDPKSEDPVLVIITTWSDKKQVSQSYLKRWKIERMFRHLKTDGFNLEANNLGTMARRNLLTLLVCLAYAITIRKAMDEKAESPTITRADGTKHARISIFQLGLDLIAPHRRTLTKFIQLVTKMIRSKNNPILANV